MRYLPHTVADRRHMLDTIGVASVDDLFDDVPKALQTDISGALPGPAGEAEVAATIGRFAARNRGTSARPSFLGAGAYSHHIPAAVDYLIQRGEFLTAYTPYQPEIAQGTLQHLFEFQSQVTRITGMEVANASMWDGATACAEAVLMAARLTRRDKAIVSGRLHPHFRDAIGTYTQFIHVTPEFLPLEVDTEEDLAGRIDKQTACVVVQYPDILGQLNDFTALAAACQAAGAQLIVAFTEVMAFGAVRAPGSFGADIVVGEGQSLGNALGYGGPYLGLFACHAKHIRQMPGRLCGQTTDSDGTRGFVLTLSTREQHIRREKATSNICTNSGLCTLAFSIHLSLLGEEGYTRLADLNHARASQLAQRLDAVPGVRRLDGHFFNEFAIRLGKPANQVVDALADKGVLAGVPVSRFYPERDDLADVLLVCATETNTTDQMDLLADALKEALS